MYMEGVLWKWTNYFSGWQARWFILDNGILSYYKSEEDVSTGCKGSVKISACDIVVHGTDPSRLDLIVPGEQHFYIKASNPQERQEWLVALGSTKATMGRSIDESGNLSPDILRTKRSELRLYCDLLMQQVHSVKMAVDQKGKPDIEKLDEATSLLGPTCDTFIQTLDDCMKIIQSSLPFEGSHPHVTDAALPTSPLKKVPSRKNRHQIQRSNSSDRPHSRSPSISSLENTPSFQQTSRPRTLSNNSSDVSLSENTNFEHHNASVSQSCNEITDLSGNVHLKKNPSHSFSEPVLHSSRQSSSMDSNPRGSDSRTSPNGWKQTGSQDHKFSSQNGGGDHGHSLTSVAKSNDLSAISEHGLGADDAEQEDVFLDPVEQSVPTFFSNMDPRTLSEFQMVWNQIRTGRMSVLIWVQAVCKGYQQTTKVTTRKERVEDYLGQHKRFGFLDIKLHSDGGIPVDDFLGASKSLIPIFDKLNAAAFAPVKMDFQGNIRKVKTKHSIRPESFQTLQSIILYEIQAKQSHLPSSASMALLWMNRSLQFIIGFIKELKTGEQNLGAAASNASAASLKPFHGWVVRGVFAVAVKALPYRSVFVSLLSPEGRKSDDPLFVQSLMSDIESFVIAVETIIKILNDFFRVNHLDSSEKI